MVLKVRLPFDHLSVRDLGRHCSSKGGLRYATVDLEALSPDSASIACLTFFPEFAL